MSAPDLSPFAARLYALVAPLSPQDADDDGWPLAWFCAGLAETLGPVEELLAPTPAGGEALDRLFDPDAAPLWALPWLGMATGTKIPRGLPEPAAREALKQTPGQDRGTASAIVGVARRHTSDPATAPVTFVAPYGGDVHTALLVVYQLTDDAVAAIARDLAAVQPAWLQVVLRNDPGWSVGQLEAAYAGRTVADLTTDFATVAAVESHLPAGA